MPKWHDSFKWVGKGNRDLNNQSSRDTKPRAHHEVCFLYKWQEGTSKVCVRHVKLRKMEEYNIWIRNKQQRKKKKLQVHESVEGSIYFSILKIIPSCFFFKQSFTNFAWYNLPHIEQWSWHFEKKKSQWDPATELLVNCNQCKTVEDGYRFTRKWGTVANLSWKEWDKLGHQGESGLDLRALGSSPKLGSPLSAESPSPSASALPRYPLLYLHQLFKKERKKRR